MLNDISIKYIKNNYIVILAILCSWILCYNGQILVGIGILSLSIFIQCLNNQEIENTHSVIVKDSAESLEWINNIFRQWWLFSNPGAENYFRMKLNKILRSNKPDFFDYILVDHIIFGDSAPSASGVKLIDYDSINFSDKPFGKLSRFIRYYSILIELNVNFNLTGTQVHLVCKHKKFNEPSNIVLKDFFISGLVNMKIVLDTGVDFPYISQISASFNQRIVPQFDYNISFSNVPNLMDRFKFWIRWIIYSKIIKKKVKVTKFELLERESKFVSKRHCLSQTSAASGVLVIKLLNLSQLPNSRYAFQHPNMCTISMDNQFYEFTNAFQADDLFSMVLLSKNIQEEKVNIKLKSQNHIGIQTVAQFDINLKEYDLEVEHQVTINKLESGIVLDINLEYLKLDPVSEGKDIEFFDIDSGILYVNLIESEIFENIFPKDGIDSYCAVFANQHKIILTDISINDQYPKWNKSVEFFIYSIKKVTLTFVVYNEKKITDDGLHEVIGINVIPLKTLTKNMINYTIPLKEFGSKSVVDKHVGSLTSSLIFRSIKSVKYAKNVLISKNELEDNSNFVTNLNNADYQTDGIVDGLDKSGIAIEIPLLKLYVMSARNLPRKDIIGLSDPYFKVKVNENEIYKSKHIKNTLNPQWNEKVEIRCFDFHDILEIEIFDKDVIKRDDFMGHLFLDAKLLHQLSMLNESKWFNLENSSTDGDIEIMAKFCKSKDICESKHENNNESLKKRSSKIYEDSSTSSNTHFEGSAKMKRLFGKVTSVVLSQNIDDDEYILKASFKKRNLLSKCKNIIKAYSISQIDKTIFFTNDAFAIFYRPSEENLKLKFKLFRRISKKKMDEFSIELQKFAELMKNSQCQLSMAKGNLINIHSRDNYNY